MAGGQKGLSFIGEAGVAFFLLGAIGGCTVRGWIDNVDSDPRSGFEHDCEQADADRRSGEEEFNEVILADPECVEHLVHLEAQEQLDHAEDLQEAQP